VYSLPEWAALVAAIKANPDDDLPRLVAADWLQEHGEDERAEWIRVSLELAKCDRAACDRCRKGWSRRRFSSYPVELGWCDHCRTKGPFWPDVERSLELRRRKNELHDKWPRAWTHADELAGLNTHGDRGFVTRVSGPLAALVGGECGRCGGDGWREVVADVIGGYHRYEREECFHCHGTGHTEGVLRRLVRREPVAEVVVSDREPVPVWDGPLHYWQCYDSSRAGWVPYRMIEAMYAAQKGGPGDTGDADGRNAINFVSSDAARSALSSAIIAWASQPAIRSTSPRNRVRFALTWE
jgi:uncharacterized protein (TIGR02996 family)